MKKVSEIDDLFVFECPNCDCLVTVNKNETACCIFRHAVYKKNGEQINPHTRKELCDELKAKNLVYGCAKPFKFVYGKDKYVIPCEYI